LIKYHTNYSIKTVRPDKLSLLEKEYLLKNMLFIPFLGLSQRADLHALLLAKKRYQPKQLHFLFIHIPLFFSSSQRLLD